MWRASSARRVAPTVLLLLVATACAPSESSSVALVRSADPAPTTAAPPPDTTVAPPAPAPTTSAVTPASAAPPPPPSTTLAPATTTTRPFIPRETVETGFTPYAVAGPVVLHHPAAVVERVGFHESGHDGARQQDAAETAARAFVMESRERGTGATTAADIVVQPDTAIRSPVTGTVKRGGGYTLYCDHRDEYLVIDPDARPGWEVKLLHFEGLQVQRGQRVEAGVTVVGARARILPFESQVDESTATPAWPHVHVEVVDPTIPDRPTPGGGCS